MEEETERDRERERERERESERESQSYIDCLNVRPGDVYFERILQSWSYSDSVCRLLVTAGPGCVMCNTSALRTACYQKAPLPTKTETTFFGNAQIVLVHAALHPLETRIPDSPLRHSQCLR